MNKTILIINSCETLDQYHSAENYAKLYSQTEDNLNNIIQVNDTLLTKYKQLIKAV